MPVNYDAAEICDIIKKDVIDLEEPIISLFAYSAENANKFITKFKNKEIESIINSPVEIGHVTGTHIGAGGFGIVYVKKNDD